MEKDDTDSNFYTSTNVDINLNIPKNYRKQQSSKSINRVTKYYSVSLSPIIFRESECLLITVKDITTEKIVD